MSWISDAHSEWHAVNGRYNTNCPLDCGAISPEQAEAEDAMNFIAYTDEEAGDARRVRCAHCKDRHATVEVVRACATLTALGEARDAAAERARLEECTHPFGGSGEDNRCPDCDTRVGWGRLPLIEAGLVAS